MLFIKIVEVPPNVIVDVVVSYKEIGSLVAIPRIISVFIPLGKEEEELEEAAAVCPVSKIVGLKSKPEKEYNGGLYAVIILES